MSENLTELQAKILSMIVQFPELSDEEIAKKTINPKTNKPTTRWYVGKLRKSMRKKDEELPKSTRKDLQIEIEKGIETGEEKEPEEELIDPDDIEIEEEEEEEDEEEEEEEEEEADVSVFKPLNTEQLGEIFALPFELWATASGVDEVAFTTQEKKKVGKAFKPLTDQFTPLEWIKWMAVAYALGTYLSIGVGKLRIYRKKKPNTKNKNKTEKTSKGLKDEKVVDTEEKRKGLFGVIEEKNRGGAGSV